MFSDKRTIFYEWCVHAWELDWKEMAIRSKEQLCNS